MSSLKVRPRCQAASLIVKVKAMPLERNLTDSEAGLTHEEVAV